MSEREDWPKHPETVRWLNDVGRFLAEAEREHEAVSTEVSYSLDGVQVTITIHSKPAPPQEPQP